MNVACSWREVNEEIVELAPVGIANELLQCTASHRASPDGCRIWIDEESDRKNLHAILFSRNDEVTTIDLLGIRLEVLKVEHLWHRRAEHIGIEQTYLVAEHRESDCKIGSDCAFTYTTLARSHGDDVLDIWQQLVWFRTWSLLCLGLDLHLDRLVHLSTEMLDVGFSSLDYRLHEWVVRFLEDERETHVGTSYAHVVLEHSALDDILLRAWIYHIGKRLFYKFWV